ncbi:hypothetical protein BC936DRAFT_139379 [Jimgerdemannia flammicorona]|uniref:Uncharacterized protein n=1 Tax=Jimgerdemannia flammicorona TaxID=994334 RepID=A0A433BA63_9FUNG|nr:hypothetical protein BC936DRAFT_139379 [Jimgerdemannia flammicorona]
MIEPSQCALHGLVILNFGDVNGARHTYGIYGPDTVLYVSPLTVVIALAHVISCLASCQSGDLGVQCELIYESQDKCDRAQLLLEWVPVLREKVSGSKHQDMATCLKNMTTLDKLQGKYDLAELSARRQILWADVSYQQGRGIALQASQRCFSASLWLPAIAENKD